MSWFVVGGIAIGATAGAIVGSKKGGDDVWKDALIGGAIGGTAGYGASALAPAAAAEAAVPAAVGAEGGAGILGAEAAAGGSGLALGGAGLETGGAMAGGASGAGIMSAAPTAATAAAPATTAGGMGLGQAGGFAGAPAFSSSGASFGSSGAAAVPQGGGLFGAPAQAAGTNAFGQAPVQMVQAPAESIAMQPGRSITDTLISARDAGNPAVTGGAPTPSMFDKALGWVEENPFKAGILGFTALGLTGALNKDNDQTFGESTVTPAGYPLSPNFKPSRYQPTRTYAIGGPVQSGMYPQSQIPDRTQFAVPTQMPASMEVLRSDYDAMTNPYTGQGSFAEGGKVDWNKQAQQFAAMTQAAESPVSKEPGFMSTSKVDPSDAGVFIDRDTETMDQPAHTAAQIRMQRLAKKYGVSYGPKTEEKEMASGGITGLGGYAHGGNPRLLRGPGDGMSDDIPATIADKQPARLADGEFVVPADVVSGLGNGSTEAGAKKLHQMMDRVRVDRTGTKKQGKQIKAEKYVPGLANGGIASYASGNLVVNPDTNEVGYWTNQNEWGFGGNWNPITQEQYNQTQTSAPVSATSNTTAQGYNPDYYNPQYYQNQLAAQQGLLSEAQAKIPEAQKQLDAYKLNNSLIGANTSTGSLYDLSNLSDTAKQNQQVNSWYQQYLGRNIGQGENFSPTQEGIMNSPEAQAWAAANAPLIEAQNTVTAEQQKLDPIQQNVNRLANSDIAYTPYTVANRPSAAEPQFYGNIYKPEYENYARPGYDMNAQLGVWNNEYGGNAMPTQRQQNIAQLAQDQRLAQQKSIENAQSAAQASRQLINQSVAEGKNQPAQEKKARKGGILAVRK